MCIFVNSDGCHSNGKPINVGCSQVHSSAQLFPGCSRADPGPKKENDLPQPAGRETPSEPPLKTNTTTFFTKGLHEASVCFPSQSSLLPWKPENSTKTADRSENGMRWPLHNPSAQPRSPRSPVSLLLPTTYSQWLGPGTQSSNMTDQPIW